MRAPKVNFSPLALKKGVIANLHNKVTAFRDRFFFSVKETQIQLRFYKLNILITLQAGQLKWNWYRNIIKHHFNSMWLSSRGANIITIQQSSLRTGLAEQPLSALRKIISVTAFTCLSGLNVLPFYTDNIWHHLQAEESMILFDVIMEPQQFLIEKKRHIVQVILSISL